MRAITFPPGSRTPASCRTDIHRLLRLGGEDGIHRLPDHHPIADLGQPFGHDHDPGCLPLEAAGEDLLRGGRRDAPRLDLGDELRQPVRAERNVACPRPSAACWFRSRLNSPLTQLAAAFGATPAATTSSK